MFSFEGDYKRKPLQNLSGKTKETRDEFLRRTQLERQKREELRKKTFYAIKVQSYIRAYLQKQSYRRKQRQLYDEGLKEPNLHFGIDDLAKHIFRLTIFFDAKLDRNRILFMCSTLLQNVKFIWVFIETNRYLQVAVKRFLLLCLQTDDVPTVTCFVQFMPRLSANIFLAFVPYFVRNGYMKHTIDLFDKHQNRPMLFLLISIPLDVANHYDLEFQTLIYRDLIRYVFMRAYTWDMTELLAKKLISIRGFSLDLFFDAVIALDTVNLHVIIHSILLFNSNLKDFTKLLKVVARLVPLMARGQSNLKDIDCRYIDCVLRFVKDFQFCENVRMLIEKGLTTDTFRLILQAVEVERKLSKFRKLPLIFIKFISFNENLLNIGWCYVDDKFTEILQDMKNFKNHMTDLLYELTSIMELMLVIVTESIFFENQYEKSTVMQSDLPKIYNQTRIICRELIYAAFNSAIKLTGEQTSSFFDSHKFFRRAMRLLIALHVWTTRLDIRVGESFEDNMIILSDSLLRKDVFLKRFEPFYGIYSPKDNNEDLPILTINELRVLAMLNYTPFVINFSTRTKYLRLFLNGIKNSSVQYNGAFSAIDVTIRRSHIYEDAYNRMNPSKALDWNKAIRVKFISEIGLEEAGVDGGGLFKEFLTSFVKAAFDTNLGFFLLNEDNTLCINPNAPMLYADYMKHYYFIGQVIGKAIFEDVLLDLPLNQLILERLVHCEMSTHCLKALDPILYKNLIYLRDYQGNVEEDLSLNFSVVASDLGEIKTVELIENGTNIAVTNTNRDEYIRELVHFKVTRQVENQLNSFLAGVYSIVNMKLFRLFSSKELKILINGNDSQMDVEDWIQNTNYSGDYSRNHPTIELFWKIVYSFSEEQKRELLKFATSCSRSPILGFKELVPPFCIQSVDDETRLPTASTCLNLLKLPIISNEETLRTKILSAMKLSVGFELS